MDPDGIERAYIPFVTLLLQGGFAPPVELAAGEQPSYDNGFSVDQDQLQSYVESVGGLPALANAVAASALRLAAARSVLDISTENCLAPTVITDAGTELRS